MKKSIYLLFIFISCTNYHEDDIIFLDSLIPSFELTLGEKRQNILIPTESSLVEATLIIKVPSVEEQTAEDPPVEEQTAEYPPVEDPPVEEQTAEYPPVEDPPVEEQTAEYPPVEDPPVEEQQEEKTETYGEYVIGTPVTYTNWAPGEPTGNQPYVFMFSSSGQWVDHENNLNNNGYGLYQIKKPLKDITPQEYSDYGDFVFVGEFNNITYFFNSTISSWLEYSKKKPLKGEGNMAIIDTKDLKDFIISKQQNWSPRAFWIGMGWVNNEWIWFTN